MLGQHWGGTPPMRSSAFWGCRSESCEVQNFMNLFADEDAGGLAHAFVLIGA